MNTSLDFSSKDFDRLLTAGIDLVKNKFHGLEKQKAYSDFPQSEIESWFDEELPQSGEDFEKVLSQVKEKILDVATNNLGPHMYAYVMAGGNQVSLIAELLAATINQNVGKWHLAPGISEIEKRVVAWSGQLIGFTGNGGVLVSGGSAANQAGLTVARNIFFEKNNIRRKGLFGMKPFTVYASTEVHNCVDKSLELLGIGTDHLRKVACLPDFTIDLKALESQIIEDIKNGFSPFCLIGTAGTVNTGAIDNLDELAAIAKRFELWFHVDGAYGGLAASLDHLNPHYAGIEKADSVAIDFHKWLYQPFEAGCLLVKEWDILRRSYFKKASYLDTELEGDKSRTDFNEHYFQLSRNAKALKIWMSIKVYGIDLLKQMIQKDLDLTEYLIELIDESNDFQLISSSSLAIACFRYVGSENEESKIQEFNQKLVPALEKDGRVFITGTSLNGKFVLRACLINHRKTQETTAFLLTVIRDVALQMD